MCRVVHFGGGVVYSARGIVAKNRDQVCRRCCGVLGAAREPLLAALFAGGPGAAGAAGGSPRRPAALACRQRALVGALVRRLPPAPRLVRCLRADHALRPHRFDAALLRHQIRSQGSVLHSVLLLLFTRFSFEYGYTESAHRRRRLPPPNGNLRKNHATRAHFYHLSKR